MSRAKDPSAEPQEISPLEALQTEKARIHGTLVSYLTCGWQLGNKGRPGTAESSVKESNESASAFAESSGYQSVSVRDSSSSQGMDDTQPQTARSVKQQQLKEIASLGAHRSSNITQRSRREEAMALLEGGLHSNSLG